MMAGTAKLSLGVKLVRYDEQNETRGKALAAVYAPKRDGYLTRAADMQSFVLA